MQYMTLFLAYNLICLKWTREFKFPHAVWAAGRGLVALLLPNFDSVDHIWLDPTSWEVWWLTFKAH
jgi:hypothetical protein